jgi:phospholipid/cholesterol/gamma-HCH transport system substrate-binding protein
MGKTRLKVGVFVTISFFLFAGAILWLAGSRFFQPVDTYQIIFTKSVSGLLPGAAVEYQGVTVGKVEALRLTDDTPPRAAVTIAVEPGTPVRKDTTAHLVGSFVTGIRFIELEGGSSTAPPMEPGGTITVTEGGLEEFRDRASAIGERLLAVLTRIEEDFLSKQNRDAITLLLHNLSLLTENLRSSLDEISTPETRTSLKAMVDNLAQAAAGIKGATDAINDIREETFKDLKAAIIQFRQTAAVTANLTRDLRQLTQNIDQIVGENRGEFRQLLANLAETSRSLQEAAETIRNDPSEIIWGQNLPEREIPDK